MSAIRESLNNLEDVVDSLRLAANGRRYIVLVEDTFQQGGHATLLWKHPDVPDFMVKNVVKALATPE